MKTGEELINIKKFLNIVDISEWRRMPKRELIMLNIG